jgi:cyclic pyranopterin phosphate synthase
MSALIDPFGRRIEYVRLSVTDRCDLRCHYCLPQGFHDFTEPEEWLTLEEIERVIGAFARLGTHRVRITGGEPLTRRNLPELAGRLAALPGIEDLSLSTNASRLAKLAEPLRRAGIERINVSLDSLDPVRFRQITQGRLDKVVDGLMAAKAVGFHPIKINMVAMAENRDEIPAMVEFCIEYGFTLRLIETMPMGETGREALRQFVDLQVVRRELETRFDLVPTVMHGGGPARYVQVRGSKVKIGFITPISQHFCETCNRVRLTAEGTIHLCLGQEGRFELRPLLRAGISDADLEQAIRAAIRLKPERHEFREKPSQVVRFMAMTGG